MLSFAIISGADSIAHLLLFSTLHETGHLLSLVAFGGRAESLTLSFYGLALKYETRLSRFKETIVILAGPAVNLFLYSILKDEVNLMLLFLNMLPIYPIDFGRVIQLYAPSFSRALSAACLFLLAAFALYMLVFYNSFSMMFIVCYLLVYTVLY